MDVHAICWHAVLYPLGREPLTPPPPGGLIWGEGRCVLLLVRNNHSWPITFTARRALVAVTHWALRGGGSGSHRNHKFTHQGCKKVTNIYDRGKKKNKPVEMQMLHSCSFGTGQMSFQLKFLWCVSPPPQDVRLKWITTYLECPVPPPPLSFPLSRPTRPLPVLFGHWRLSVGVYVQFTGAERSQFHVLLWNKTSLPLRSDEKWSGWAGWAGSGTIPWRRPAVRKSKRLLCRCCRLRVW